MPAVIATTSRSAGATSRRGPPFPKAPTQRSRRGRGGGGDRHLPRYQCQPKRVYSSIVAAGRNEDWSQEAGTTGRPSHRPRSDACSMAISLFVELTRRCPATGPASHRGPRSSARARAARAARSPGRAHRRNPPARYASSIRSARSAANPATPAALGCQATGVPTLAHIAAPIPISTSRRLVPGALVSSLTSSQRPS